MKTKNVVIICITLVILALIYVTYNCMRFGCYV